MEFDPNAPSPTDQAMKDQQQRQMMAMLLRQQSPGASPAASAINGLMQGLAMKNLMRPGLAGMPPKQPGVAPNLAGPDAGMLGDIG